MFKHQYFKLIISIILLLGWAVFGLFKFEYSNKLSDIRGHYVKYSEVDDYKCIQTKAKRERATVTFLYDDITILIQLPDTKCKTLKDSIHSSEGMSFYIFNNKVYQFELNGKIIKSFEQIKHFTNLYSFIIYIFPILLFICIKIGRFYLYQEKL